MATPILPRAQGAALGTDGAFAAEWRRFFESLLAFVGESSDSAAAIQSILDRLAALEEGESVNIQGLQSVQVQGSDVVQISLVNDDGDVGNTYYYGTTADGTKGWFTVESAFDVAAGELTKTVGPDGVTAFGLDDLADAGTGTFKLITRDAKGRVSGTVAGDTDDVPEGTTNLYFTDERVDDRVSSLLVAGSNITLTYNDPAGTLTVASTGGGGGGSVSLVATSTVAGAAATNITISSLDLAAAETYWGILSADNANASVMVVNLFYNGDTTATNYNNQQLVSSGTSTASTRANNATISSVTASEAFFCNFVIRQDPDGRPRAHVVTNRDVSASIVMQHNVHVRNNTANVTSLTVNSSTASGFAIGTKLSLYKITP